MATFLYAMGWLKHISHIISKITTSHDIFCLQNDFQNPIIMILYMDALWMRENICIWMDSNCITIPNKTENNYTGFKFHIGLNW